MSDIDTINAYKSKMAMTMNSQLFKGDVLVHKKGRGEIKWVATPETLDIVFGNLKRSIHSRTPMAELTNLFTSIEQNKFATQIKIFTKFYTNPQYSSSDINLGSCPQIDKKIPYNIHKQDKEYFVTLIINWYEKYYLWKQKNKAPSKPPRHPGTNANSSKIVPLVSEAIPVAEGWQEVQGAAISEFEIDAVCLPLGALSATQLQTGYAALVEIRDAVARSAPREELVQLSNAFYSTIPHAFGRSVPPPLASADAVSKKFDMLNMLSDTEIPDSWDNDSEEGETAIAPESWEDIVEEDL